MLKDIIPAEWRKPIYAIYAVVGVILGTIAVSVEPDPSWLVPTMAGYMYVGGAFGFTASANTNVMPEYAGPDGYVPQRVDDGSDPAPESVEAEPADTE